MSKAIPWMILIGMATVLLSISFCQPQLLDDRNKFLAGFVNQELLSTLGFIMAVTLASASSLYLELNKLEDTTGKTFLRTRTGIRKSAYGLLVLFSAAVVLVIVKPLLPDMPYNCAVANSFAILIIYFNISTLFDLTRTVFHIPSVTAIKLMK